MTRSLAPFVMLAMVAAPAVLRAAQPPVTDAEAIFERARTTWSNMTYPSLLDCLGAGSRLMPNGTTTTLIPCGVSFGTPDLSPLYSFGMRTGKRVTDDEDPSTLKTIGPRPRCRG
jgi:hypothetical protein